MKKTIFSFIQICLSIFFIYLTFSNINIKSLKIIIENSNLLLLALSPILYFISQIISSERLRNLLNVNGFNLSFLENGKLYVIGMFYNFFIPGGIGGDMYKTYLFKKNLQLGNKQNYQDYHSGQANWLRCPFYTTYF